MSNVTKEGVVVKVGQVWRDLDVRIRLRECRVVEVDADTGYVRIRRGIDPNQKTSRIRINRMHKGSTGWALVSEAP